MCNDEVLFSDLNNLKRPQEVSLGDGHVLEATAEGTRAEEALINWSGQEVGVAKDNAWVWSSTIHTFYSEYFVFLSIVNNC